jgi:glycosyltransferase involved in cell wall biosynthesis
MKKQNKKVHIIFIIPTLAHGGAQRVLYEIITHLDRKLFDCQIICFSKSETPYNFKDKATVRYLNFQNINQNFNFFYKFAKLLRIILQLRQTIKMLDVSAILIPFMARPATAYTVISQLFLKNRRRIVASLHTAESVCINFNYQYYIQKKAEEILLKIACLGADKIILHSQAIKDDLIQNYSIPAEKMTVIPNPLDINKIRLLRHQSSIIDGIIDNDQVIFSHVGRLSVEKNHLLFIHAVHLLIKRGYKFRAIIAGAGNQDKNIKRWIKELEVDKHIELVGALDNPYPLMAKSRALVLTSHYDASPMVLREAMASGTSVISVDCPFGPKNILENGKLGLLVPVSDPEALADAMQLILNNDKLFDELKQKGLKHSTIFDTTNIAKKWENLLLPNNNV